MSPAPEFSRPVRLVLLGLALASCSGGGGSSGGASEGTDAATGTTGAGATADGSSSGAPTTGDVGFVCTPQAVVVLTKGFFRDISDASGIRVDNFVVDPPQPIPINDHSRLAFADLDGDGFDDLVAHSLFPNPQAGVPFEHLVFLNNGDGTFRHHSDASGLRGVQAGFFAFGDVDNDGDQDVFAGLDIPLGGETNRIFLNDGAAHFTEKVDAGVAVKNLAANAVFADFNGDANLDLFLGNGQTGYTVSDQLLFGLGDGSFADITAAYMPGDRDQPSNGSVACDYDDDGDLDIFVSTYSVSTYDGHNHLWENDGTGHFKEVGLERGFAAQITGNYWLMTTGYGTDPEPDVTLADAVGSNGFGIQCEDATGDGLPDVFLTAISHPVASDYARKWSDPSQLLVNGGPGAGYAFTNEYLARGLPFNEGDVDGAMVDFDNDGRMDLSMSRDRKYEDGYTEIDQKGWFGLMRQLEGGTFESVVATSGINDGQAAWLRMKQAQNHAWADIDHDGDLDLLVGGRDTGGGRPNFLFENTIGEQNAWMTVRLRGDGVNVNRDAIGARVQVRFAGWTLSREVKSGRGTYNSHDTRALHFGLGDLGCDYTVEVRWPDGMTQTYGPSEFPVGRRVIVDYVDGVIVEP